jgi:hypothetical protein
LQLQKYICWLGFPVIRSRGLTCKPALYALGFLEKNHLLA